MKSVPHGTPLKFFLLVFGLSVPFWLIGAVTGMQLLSGLPVSALMVVCPVAAASILTYRENGTAVLGELLRRSFDYERTTRKLWYLPAVLLMPGATVLTYGVMRLLGMPLATPQFSPLMGLIALPLFFIAALGEELGWSGYALDRMQGRRTALHAGAVLGLVWAAWHIIPLMQVSRPPVWITWWGLFTVATRILLVWLYNNTGKSVFAVSLYHGVSNTCVFLFPDYYDPLITGSIIAFVAAGVVIVSEPQTLTYRRRASDTLRSQRPRA